MELKTKISVVGVLALGSIACFATVARIPYAKQLLSNPDYLYNLTDLAIWSTVEIGLGLSVSSLATLKPLFRKLMILATTRRTDGGDTKHTAKSSVLNSRKMSTLGMGFGSNSRTFSPLEDAGSSQASYDSWPTVPGKKAGDVEMGNLRELGFNEKVSSGPIIDTGQASGGREKAASINFSLRRPSLAHQ